MGYRSDVPEIISTLDIGILISEYESFGMPIIEFLSMGCPVIATEVGVASEVETNLISEPDPKLLYQALRQVSSANYQMGSETLEKFEAENFFEGLKDITRTAKL